MSTVGMAPAASSSWDWSAIAAKADEVVSALAPIIEGLDPALALAIDLGERIAQGALAEVPAAVALVEQLQSGTPITPAQLQDYIAAEDTSYAALKAAIAAKLAALPR